MSKGSTIALAVVAVFLALGGTAIAGSHYIISSTSQIKPSVLRRLHGREGAPGPAGPVGPPGPAGPVALSGITEVVGPKELIGEEVGSSLALCPAGTHAVSGGGAAITLDGMAASEMSAGHQGWFVIAAGTSFNSTVQAVAYCAGAGQAVAASRPRADAATLEQIRRIEAQIRAAHRQS